MHTYAQVLQKRFLGSGGSIENWRQVASSGLVERIFEAAPSCKCGCGGKLIPGNLVDLVRHQNRKPGFYHTSLPYHGRLCLPANYQFSKLENELIIASCLGDGSLLNSNEATGNPSSYRLIWNMGNEDHALFKQRAFSFLKCSFKESVNPGWGSRWFQLATKYHPALNQYRPMMYDSDRRPVARPEVLSQLGATGWAWWYGDDGSLSHKHALLHTEGYDSESNLNIANALCAFLDIPNGAVLQDYQGGSPKKLRTMVRLKDEASRKFFRTITQHMAPSMAYKLGGIC